MKNLTCKDWVIVGLFFALLAVISPLIFLIDETPVESSLPWLMGLLGSIGFLLSMPIIFIAGLFSEYPLNPSLLSWLTAIIYSAILCFILSKINSRQSKK